MGKIATIGLALALLGTACATPEPADPGAWPRGQDYIQVKATGKPGPDETSDAQRKYTSREAARIQAEALLIQRVQQLPMKHFGHAAVEMSQDPAFAQMVKATIKGATEVEAVWDDAFDCTVTLHLSKDTLKALDSRFRF